MWYNFNWLYRVKVTVDYTKVKDDLSDYPLYISLASLPAGFHSNVKANGADIRVTTSDGITELPREVVFYDQATDTGELHIKTSLSDSANTELYIYYGNSSATEPATDATYGAENVWSSNYNLVYHLQQDPSGSSPQILDSTANDYDGTSSGSMTSDDLVTGKLAGKGIDFDGSNDYITAAIFKGISGANQRTVQAWVKTSTGSGNQHYVEWGLNNSGERWSNKIDTGGLARTEVQSGYNLATTNNADSNFRLIHTVLPSGASNVTQVLHYVNGAADASTASSTRTINTSNATNYVLIGGSTMLSRYYVGTLDEVRILNVALTAKWIETEYNNQNSPSTFYSIGSQQANPATVALNTPTDNSTTSDTTPTFNFTGTDEEDSDIEYQIQISPAKTTLALELRENSNDFHNNFDGTDTNISYGMTTTKLSAIFNGTSSKILITNTIASLSVFSISLYVYTTDNVSERKYFVRDATSGTDWAFYVGQYDGKYYWGMKTDTWHTYYTLTTVGLNEWKSIIFTYDGTTAKLYVNTSLIDTQTPGSIVSQTSKPFKLGYLDTQQFHSGSLFNFFVFDYVISEDERNALFACGGAGLNYPFFVEPPGAETYSFPYALSYQSTLDSGFTSGHPFGSGDAIDFTIPIADELDVDTEYFWQVRAKDVDDTNEYGDWSTMRSFEVLSTSIKTVDGLAKASVKTINGLAIASVKTWNGLT